MQAGGEDEEQMRRAPPQGGRPEHLHAGGLAHRRLFLAGAAGLAAASLPGCAASPDVASAPPSAPPPDRTGEHYSESVALVLFAEDGSREVSLRLARMPGRRTSTIWASVDDGPATLALADRADLAPGALATPVETARAVFSVEDRWTARFDRRLRAGRDLRGRVAFTGRMHGRSEPPEGEGDLAVRIEADFEALHAPSPVRPGRLEVFGRGSARLHLPDRRLQASGFAKWHEQTGERVRFAPAFTYVSIIGPSGALLAVASERAHYGFALEGGRTVPVTRLDISELGDDAAAPRTFTARLADGRSIEGATRTLRTGSVPIEGQRRPGATVVAETGLGRMVGHINDWRPAPA